MPRGRPKTKQARIYVKILHPSVMELGGPFGRRLGHEGGANVGGISAL